MLSKNQIWGSLTGLGLLIGMATTAKVATPAQGSVQTNQFHSIEQPLGVKVGVTVGGIGLIGLELWWFLFSKTKAQQAQASEGVQEITITVDGGYDPSRVVVNSGQPVRLNFWRKDPSDCLEKVLIPDFHIARDLELNQVTQIEFMPEKPGEYPFTCGMNMFRGVVEVQGVSQPSKRDEASLITAGNSNNQPFG
ncbi:MAG: cupredoxin domain-containing protein [Chroococcidiopsidaceae cyanobacterium CP_BM_ER_R8_30]|nr:cupredoxin domain-containing protein [Chroococcidiopsidaceae cyanobacterium CP_BM_ER_R8_30]